MVDTKDVRLQTAYLVNARQKEPEGAECSFCHQMNDLADDIGWFYIHPTEEQHGFCCKACYAGEPGQKHIARFGLGER